jgi:uncharacterized protein (TIGR02217 family)
MPVSSYTSTVTVATPAVSSVTAPEIDEVRLPIDFSYGMTFGPGYATIVVETASGAEQRIIQWSKPRYRGRVGWDIRDQAQAVTLIDFFNARMGRAYGFRLRDPKDYTVTNETLTYNEGPTIQLTKTYTSGPRSLVRNIFKPVAPITMRRNSSSFVAFTLDDTTGIVTLTPTKGPKTITNITKAASAVVSATAHGFADGDRVYFAGVSGMTSINGLTATIASHNANDFTVSLNTTSYTTYSSGGTAAVYYAVSDVFDWTGEFDVAVRFDDDAQEMSLDDIFIASWNGIAVVELR